MRSKFRVAFSPLDSICMRKTWRLGILGSDWLAIPMVWGLVLATSGLMVEEPWKEKPYTQWTPEDVVTVLRNSPWARIVSVVEHGKGSPGASEREALARSERQRLSETPSSLPGEGHVSFSDSEGAVWRTPIAVAWISSRTFREAVVRAHEMEESKSEVAEAKQFLESHPKEYMIGLDYRLASAVSREEWTKQVGASAYLEAKKSKRKIKPLKTETTKPSLAPFAKLIVFFPRTIEGQPAFALPEEAVDFHVDVPSGKKLKHVKVTFELKKMMRGGAPDL